jgi:hypothetical protein
MRSALYTHKRRVEPLPAAHRHVSEMRRIGFSLATIVLLLSGCGSATSTPSAVASPEVVCDNAQFQPPPALNCGPAIAASVVTLPPGHPPIVREEFRWGGLCPPGAPCAAPYGNAGIVIFEFATEPSVFVYVSVDAAGVVAATTPAPYPSGY